MFRRIRWRLLAIYLIVIFLALAFLGLHLTQYFEGRYLAVVENGLLAQARLIAVHVRDAVAARGLSRARSEFLGTHYPGNPVVVIVDSKTEVLVDYPGNASPRSVSPLRRESLRRALAGRDTSGSTQVDGVPIVYAAVPIKAGGEVVGAVYVALPLVELTVHIQHTRVFVAWTVAGTLIGAALTSLLLAHRIAGPIQDLRAATARIAAGDLGQRVVVRTPDELGDLARSLNYMAAELERLDTTRREFVADASHELRTPVANLAVAVEALRGSVPSADPSVEALLSGIEREVQRLRLLVDDLLDLSAIEAGRPQLYLSPTDITRVVSSVIASFRARARRSDIALEQAGPANGVSARADADRMAQVLSNLLDNALKFTPRGGQVTLTVSQHRGAVTVSVEDTGPGIPPGDLPHIFDRFFKTDRSRSGHRGAGLGLAIAKRLVTAQGGDIKAENRPEGGAQFVVTLPA